VPGLGEIRRKALITYFGSLRKLRAATVEQIAEVPGIGPRTATAIKEALSGQEVPVAINMTTGEVIEQ
jgi:excinuclease ABC subunit C